MFNKFMISPFIIILTWLSSNTFSTKLTVSLVGILGNKFVTTKDETVTTWRNFKIRKKIIINKKKMTNLQK